MKIFNTGVKKYSREKVSRTAEKVCISNVCNADEGYLRTTEQMKLNLINEKIRCLRERNDVLWHKSILETLKSIMQTGELSITGMKPGFWRPVIKRRSGKTKQ